jgi:hypothetical protein
MSSSNKHSHLSIFLSTIFLITAIVFALNVSQKIGMEMSARQTQLALAQHNANTGVATDNTHPTSGHIPTEVTKDSTEKASEEKEPETGQVEIIVAKKNCKKGEKCFKTTVAGGC